MENLADIAVFVRVVQRGSFTLAADDLDLSRAAVSKYLTRLEEAKKIQRLIHRMQVIINEGHPTYGHQCYSKALAAAAGYPVGDVRPPLTTFKELGKEGEARVRKLQVIMRELDDLNDLVRCDCTTRNKARARALARRMDELEARITALREQEELDRIRPPLNGREVMEFLGIPPGPLVGEALDFLLEARLDEGPIDEADAYARLAAWAAERGIPTG